MSELYYCTCDPHGDNAKCDRPCARPNHERQLRSLATRPYDSAELRVAQWIVNRTNIGAGDDPVGFILASYEFKIHELDELRRTTNREIQQLRRLLERWVSAADSGIWRDRSNLSLAATMLADDTRDVLRANDQQ